IFFGILIGDAGYGLIFFILTLLAQLRLGRRIKQRAVFTLFYILSACAVIWGALSGTFFGQEWLPQWVRPVIPALRNDKNVQAFCFLLGVLHLSIAHFWRGIIKLPSVKALADLGWVLILWGAYFLAKLLILRDAYPESANSLFIAGGALVVFFTNPRRNLLKGIGSGIGNLLLNLVGNFTDIVSYIRLFAVGLATVAVADTFNKMALDIGYNSFLTGLFSALILLLGHTLNILLGPMAILVHGVRLNVLEFCNHLDIKWSGFSYNPLRERAGTIPANERS
ncbi:MAG: V-type ATP synthase subunit I, partial [Candidatus Omnitrophota bacterium]|nr:V-type ATP synthase subunit I [Candidatus Omnitrophota bacterium]